MKAQEIMTEGPACCTPDDTAQTAARLMDENDCGCVPVVEDQDSRRLAGVVTDRDIALRGVGRGRGAETRVSELMSSDVSCCGPDSEMDEVERIMSERQVRRVPVIDGAAALAWSRRRTSPVRPAVTSPSATSPERWSAFRSRGASRAPTRTWVATAAALERDAFTRREHREALPVDLRMSSFALA